MDRTHVLSMSVKKITFLMMTATDRLFAPSLIMMIKNYGSLKMVNTEQVLNIALGAEQTLTRNYNATNHKPKIKRTLASAKN